MYHRQSISNCRPTDKTGRRHCCNSVFTSRVCVGQMHDALTETCHLQSTNDRLRLRSPPFLSEHRTTRFLHLWRSLATLRSSPCHSQAPYFFATRRQVYCGLLLDLFSSSRVLCDICRPDLLAVSVRGQPTPVTEFSAFRIGLGIALQPFALTQRTMLSLK